MTSTASVVKRPLKFKVINFLGKIATSRPNLSKQYLIDAACKSTGLDDWGSENFMIGLNKLLSSAKYEANLHFFGRQFLQKGCIRSIKDRLRLQSAFKKNPEILKLSIKNPIFIIGFPRTGTTFLQNLLFQDNRFRHLHYWEQVAVGPQPTPMNLNENYIIKSCTSFVNKLKMIAPEFFIAHEINANGPEECNGLMERNFSSIIYFMFRNLPSYMEWFKNNDMTETYDYHKMQLQFLGYHFKKKQWVLKAPVHLLFLKYLFKTYPDAKILFMHRDPVKVIPSMASLGVISRQIHSDYVNPDETASQFLDLMSHNMYSSIQFRKEFGESQFLDISYKKLVKDTSNILQGIYNWLEIELNQNLKEKISNWLKISRQKHSKNSHIYTLDQFNLSKTKISNKFEFYYDNYADYLDQYKERRSAS